MAAPAIVAAAQKRVAGNALGQQWSADVYEQAVQLLAQPTATVTAPRTRRTGIQGSPVMGRTLLHNIQLLGLAYLWWGDQRFAAKARDELLAAAALPDWDPSNFLNVAETAHAFGIGYDWLYQFLDQASRDTIAAALVDKGLSIGLAEIDAGVLWAQNPARWNLNWMLVCLGGLTLGALGIYESKPDLCDRIIGETLDRIPQGFAAFAPEGGWAEGPGYWHVASSYAVYLIAGLETALGTDYGLAESLGFDVAGSYRLHMQGPSGLLFNYADGDPTHSGLPWVFWLANRFDLPVDAWVEQTKAHTPYSLDLLWFDADAQDPQTAGEPLARRFAGIEVAALRGAWNDPDATYAAVKGGDNAASDHSHLDLGSFVLDSGGQRFTLDLGEDDYTLPGYFDRTQRFQYYRTGTIGHNVVIVDGQNQGPEATASLALTAEDNWAAATIELSRAYQQCALRRTVYLVDRRNVVIVDDIVPFQAVQPTWQMHTAAAVALDGAHAKLTLGGAGLTLGIVEPAGAVFAIADCHPPPPQNPNTGITKLVVAIEQIAVPGRIVIALSPDASWVRGPGAAAIASVYRRSAGR